jgi:hypothetical protein
MASSALRSVWYLDSGTFFHVMGDDVVFSDGKYFMRHKTMGQVKKIGIRVKKSTRWRYMAALP